MESPLAERMRPHTLEGFAGQKHLVGEGAILRKMLESGQLSSIILWGPPGVGKTTLARIISTKLERPFYVLSAVSSGVKEVREVIDKAKKSRFFNSASPVLFIDEIHRFNKAQQDSLLGAVEEGVITLIGATTENPSFEVISPLLSRSQVYVLQPLEKRDLMELWDRVISTDELLKKRKFILKEDEALMRFAGGDARKFLNIIELVVNAHSPDEDIIITNENVTENLQQNPAMYDKNGEMHYDIISAFIKSMRGSDPDAAVYWLARMVEGGEDPKFIARRMLILAAEDVGLANPNALLIATNCFEAINMIGWPEARILLSETAIYLATSPKSNSAYMAIESASAMVRETGNLPVPLHLRNAPTKLMKDLNYGKSYKYSHDYEGNFAEQEYLPKKILNSRFYIPQNNQQEIKIKERLIQLWKNRFK